MNLKRKATKLGNFSYDEVLPRLKAELDRLISARGAHHASEATEGT